MTEQLENTSPEEAWPIIKAQARSFFKAPLCFDLNELKADVALIGVPFDQGTLGRPGARFGPDAIRDAPRTYSYSDPYGDQTPAGGFFDVDVKDELLRGVTMADCGNITIVPSEVARNFAKITEAVEKAVERGAFPVVVGGDHSITFPVVRGLHKFAPLNIVHFDAHLDYSRNPTRPNHRVCHISLELWVGMINGPCRSYNAQQFYA
ncbi:MAG: hypothetical protein DWG76_08170 [Chloroflexi bacterium]|nr:hypothetical protein [Chloroflexota bacterium]